MSAAGGGVHDSPQELDVLAWLGRAALETIGRGTLGYYFEPLVKDSADTYGEALKSLVYVHSSCPSHAIYFRVTF